MCNFFVYSFLNVFGFYEKKLYYYFAYVVLFLSGALFTFALPPFNFFFLALISLFTSSLIFIKSPNIKVLFCMALSYSFGCALFGLYWVFLSINHVLHDFFVSLLTFVGFCVLYSIYAFITALVLYFSPKKERFFIFFVILAWGLAEFTKYYLFGGFPWLIWSLVWDFDIYIMQVAYIFGSFGLSLLTIFLFSVIFLCIMKDITKNVKYCYVCVTVILFSLVHLYGYSRINQQDVDNHDEILVRIVNTAIEQDTKFNLKATNTIIENISNYAFDNLSSYNKTSYVLLPETVVPFDIREGDFYYNKLIKNMPKNTYLFFGAIANNNEGMFNNIYAINGNNKRIEFSYSKLKLVPFGESIPLVDYFPVIQKVLGVESVKAGKQYSSFFDKKNNLFLYPIICFEAAFPNILPKINKKKGFESLVFNISNEAWFDGSIELDQYVALLRYRAIENNVKVVKSSNLGISVVIDSFGRYVLKHHVRKFEVLDVLI